jgi:hypothetical protein
MEGEKHVFGEKEVLPKAVIQAISAYTILPFKLTNVSVLVGMS